MKQVEFRQPYAPSASERARAERTLNSPVFAPGAFFGYFKLIGRVRTPRKASPALKVIWRVQCVCGNLLKVPQYYMKRQKPKYHCGCQNQSLKTLYNREYRIWLMMHKRCYDGRHVAYDHYGGRGITIHPSWHRDIAGMDQGFENFLNHIGPAPTHKHSIDRINVNGPYAPGNVRWATDAEQATNRRSSGGQVRKCVDVSKKW